MPSFGAKLKNMRDIVWKFAFPADFPKPIRKADGQNSVLGTYLDYYRNLDAPGFAVLVTGEWGVGKTHQVLHSLDENEFFYVSLFGLRTAEEVRAAVFAQMFPSRHRIKGFIADAKQALNAASGLFAIGSLTPTLMSAFLDRNVSAERTLIFDDLERSQMPLKVLLGVINNYVEHAGIRAIVIVHDKRVLDSYLSDAKEKMFGQELKAVPQTRQAFDAFMESHRNMPFGHFLTPYAEDVLDIFCKSGQPSLRLLKYLIEDLRRFYEALQERHRQHQAMMLETIRMMSVFAIEIRAKIMTSDDLFDRARQAYGDSNSKIAQANTRYGAIRLDSTTLQDQLLARMFLQGIYDREEISKSLDDSYHFNVAGEDQPWRTVINFDKLDDRDVMLAVDRMNKQIQTFQDLVPGEMLHILALRLMMAEQDISDETPDEVVASAKVYIDAMSDREKIPPRPRSYDWKHERYDAYDGVGFWVSDAMNTRFQQIVDHLKQAQQFALERELRGETPALLKALHNGEGFFEMVVTTYTGNNPYAHVPVLDFIDPRNFVTAWLAAPKESWYWIGNAINERFKASFHTKALRRERHWARQVVELLYEEIEKLQGFSKLRLSRAIPRSVGTAEDDEADEPVIATVAMLDTQPANASPAIAKAEEPRGHTEGGSPTRVRSAKSNAPRDKPKTPQGNRNERG